MPKIRTAKKENTVSTELSVDRCNTEKGEMVKPFTLTDMSKINKQLLRSNSIINCNVPNMNLIKYVYQLTHRYADICNDLRIIKQIDQIFENRAIYQFFYDLENYCDKSRLSGMKNIFWYVFYSLYLDIVHSVYGIVAYEFNIDGICIANDTTKRQFFDALSSEKLKQSMLSVIHNSLSLDAIARCIMDNIGEDSYNSMDDKLKLEYFREYTKPVQTTFVDYATSTVVGLLSGAIFDILLYDEDVGGSDYGKVADAIIPIINDFRNELDEVVGVLIGIFTLDFISPTPGYYFYD